MYCAKWKDRAIAQMSHQNCESKVMLLKLSLDGLKLFTEPVASVCL